MILLKAKEPIHLIVRTMAGGEAVVPPDSMPIPGNPTATMRVNGIVRPNRGPAR